MMDSLSRNQMQQRFQFDVQSIVSNGKLYFFRISNLMSECRIAIVIERIYEENRTFLKHNILSPASPCMLAFRRKSRRRQTLLASLSEPKW
jgi:hypothetical protein